MVTDADGFHAVPPPTKIYTAIVDQILNAIQAGTFLPGSALPSERQLSERLGISRVSLREAVRVLEHTGVVEVRPGRGTFIAPNGLSKAASLRARTAVAGEHSPLDLMVVRLRTEPLAAELAASHRSARDLKALDSNIRQHQNLLRSATDLMSADGGLRLIGRKFHLAVADAAHNGVLQEIQHRYAELQEEDTWSRLKSASRRRSNLSNHYLDDHREIVEHIRAADPDAAGRAMLDHLIRLRDALQDVVTD